MCSIRNLRKKMFLSIEKYNLNKFSKNSSGVDLNKIFQEIYIAQYITALILKLFVRIPGKKREKLSKI